MSPQIEETARTIVRTKVADRQIDQARHKMLQTEPDMDKRRAKLTNYREQEQQLRDDAHGEAAAWWGNGG